MHLHSPICHLSLYTFSLALSATISHHNIESCTTKMFSIPDDAVDLRQFGSLFSLQYLKALLKPFHYQADRIMHVFLMVLTDDLSEDRHIGDNGGDNITHRKN